MSEIKVKSLTGRKSGTVELPEVFNTPLRADLIKRAVLSDQTKKRQPQGRYKLAGRLGAWTATRPGRGKSLVPRTHGSGTHHSYRGTFIPSTRGGRLAHPPRVEKNIVEKINKKEYALALKSAISATKDKEVVQSRGHEIPKKVEFPIIVVDKFTEINKTKEMAEVLSNLGLGDDLERSKRKKIRPGKGKMRGRKYIRPRGPLVVVSDECDAIKASKNLPGVDVTTVQDLTVEMLAPGATAGRATVWTESAIAKLSEWK